MSDYLVQAPGHSIAFRTTHLGGMQVHAFACSCGFTGEWRDKSTCEREADGHIRNATRMLEAAPPTMERVDLSSLEESVPFERFDAWATARNNALEAVIEWGVARKLVRDSQTGWLAADRHKRIKIEPTLHMLRERELGKRALLEHATDALFAQIQELRKGTKL